MSMERPYSANSSSSSSNIYLSQKSKSPKLQRPFRSSSSLLHPVRRSVTKPCKKPAVMPLPPTHPRIYKVDPINFRGLVRKLTGATELGLPRRLQNMAPPQLEHLAKQFQEPPPFSTVGYQQDLGSGESQEMRPHKMSDNKDQIPFSFGMNLSPSSHNWFSFPLLSPETLSGFEHNMSLQLFRNR